MDFSALLDTPSANLLHGVARAQFVGRVVMLDIIFLAATALFFAFGILYVRGCERLR
jgi:hypothetical protein